MMSYLDIVWLKTKRPVHKHSALVGTQFLMGVIINLKELIILKLVYMYTQVEQIGSQVSQGQRKNLQLSKGKGQNDPVVLDYSCIISTNSFVLIYIQITRHRNNQTYVYTWVGIHRYPFQYYQLRGPRKVTPQEQQQPIPWFPNTTHQQQEPGGLEKWLSWRNFRTRAGKIQDESEVPRSDRK